MKRKPWESILSTRSSQDSCARAFERPRRCGKRIGGIPAAIRPKIGEKPINSVLSKVIEVQGGPGRWRSFQKRWRPHSSAAAGSSRSREYCKIPIRARRRSACTRSAPRQHPTDPPISARFPASLIGSCNELHAGHAAGGFARIEGMPAINKSAAEAHYVQRGGLLHLDGTKDGEKGTVSLIEVVRNPYVALPLSLKMHESIKSLYENR